MVKEKNTQVKNTKSQNITPKKKNKIMKIAKIESLPKDIRSSIPFLATMPNGVIETEPGTFTKSYVLKDVDFLLAPREDQVNMYKSYMAFLNSFNEKTRWQINIFNHKIPKKDTIEKIHIEPQADGLNEYRNELNNYLLDQLVEGTNQIVQEKYLTVSIDEKNVDHAMATLNKIDNEVSDSLEQLCGSTTKPMSLVERMKLFYNIYNQDTDYRFSTGIFKNESTFNLDFIAKQGLSPKDIIGPSGMDFSPWNHFKFGDTYGRVFYLDRIPQMMKPTFISDIAALPCNMLISVTYNMLTQEEIRKILKSQLLEIRGQIDDILKPTAENPFGGRVTSSLTNAEENAEIFEQEIVQEGQKAFNTSVLVAVFADSLDELKDITENIQYAARNADCPLKIVYGQQEFGINHCLPLCRHDMDFVERLYTTKNAAIFIPYKARDLIQKNAVFYGLNQTTNNLILYDRHKGDNFNALWMGISGSGKSFKAKFEIASLFLSRPTDQFFIIDPQSEFIKLGKAFNGSIISIAPGNGVYINPMDLDLSSDKDEDPIATKVDFILSLIDIMNPQDGGLDATCKSIIDRVLRKIYKPYIKKMSQRTDGATMDSSICPTLNDLYQELKRQNSPAAEYMAGVLEIYTIGSLNTFSHRSNIQTDNRFVVYDIAGLGKGLEDLGLHICCGDMWNRLKQNSNNDLWTNVYIDEMHLLLHSKVSAQFIEKLWKMARKWQGVLNGILQGPSDFLYGGIPDINSSAILSNTSFFVLMKSAFMERQILTNLFSLSESQVKYINDTAPKGTGLIHNGLMTIPFTGMFPKELKLYSLFTTSHDE